MSQNLVWDLFRNPVFITAVTAWFTAQLIKFILCWAIDRRIDVTRMWGFGGMPSSHTSFVASISVAIGLREGFSSNLFLVATAFTIVVMADAQGVRRAAGNQARVINEIVDALQHRQAVEQKKLIELLGHTPIEVLAGFILGIGVAVAFYYGIGW